MYIYVCVYLSSVFVLTYSHNNVNTDEALEAETLYNVSVYGYMCA